MFGMMALFAVLRSYDVAIDYSNRVNQMYQLFKMGLAELLEYTERVQDGEYLYTLFIWGVSRVFPVPWLINGIMDIFVLSTFGWFIGKYSKDVTFSTLMYLAFVFAASLNITRQYVATAFFLIALHLLLQKKPIKALIPMVIAVLFHVSAILLFAVYALYFIGFKINRTKLVLMLILTFGLFFTFDLLFDLFLHYFPQYSYALGKWAVGDQSFSFLWLAIYTVMFVCLFIAVPSFRKEKNNITVEVSGLVSISFMLYALINLLQSELWFVSRLNAYFIFGYCMVIPEIIDGFKLQPQTRLLVNMILKTGIALWAVSMFLQNTHEILPYQFIWDTLH